jgi:hypothetical protein
MKGASHVDASAGRGAGDFGISVFHRARRCRRAAASSLNRFAEDRIFLVEHFVEPSVFATDSAQISAGIAFDF